MMFIPQVILAIAASSLGPGMARRWSLKRVLRAAMSADLLAMILLATSRLLPALLEQHQRADGTVAVPEVLRRWGAPDVLRAH